jgi:catechol 2,3-dioxygenase-like lactoylglutathione lyase family enzyme
MAGAHELAEHAARGTLHHVELWVPDLGRAVANFGWLLECLGYMPYQNWEHGRSWRLGDTYIVIEQSPALTADTYDRLRPGLNHLAFHAGPASSVDQLVSRALERGWSLLFPGKHPHAGGPQHYAAYLTDTDGFEIELVAQDSDEEPAVGTRPRASKRSRTPGLK